MERPRTFDGNLRVLIHQAMVDCEKRLLYTLESLSTEKFLHDGGLFSVSGLDGERCFWREFLT